MTFVVKANLLFFTEIEDNDNDEWEDDLLPLLVLINSYCKNLNKFGQLEIHNRIEYVIFYLFLVNIIGNCHENKYILIYCDA
jgi:uncharacterized protein YlbG (UPF0298 family)